MIERGFTIIATIGSDGVVRPGIHAGIGAGYKERAYLECGCSCYVGMRFDTDEAITGARQCSPEHTDLIARFNMLLRESLDEPSDRELVEVCDELLHQAARAAS